MKTEIYSCLLMVTVAVAIIIFLSISALPIITPQSNTITGLINQSIEIGVVITRDYPFVKPSDINWVFNGLIIAQSDKYGLTVDKKSLTILSLSSEDDGMYTIMATNAAGYTEAVITLHVLGMSNVIYRSLKSIRCNGCNPACYIFIQYTHKYVNV